LFEIFQANINSDEFEQKAFLGAIDILKGMNSGDGVKAKILIAIPYIPDIKELADVHVSHSSALLELSFEQYFGNMIKMIRHDSCRVRLMAMQRILALLRDKRYKFFDSNITSFFKADNLLSVLMRELLLLSSREIDCAVKIICAECLGELVH
jgi:hypothetical protein